MGYKRGCKPGVKTNVDRAGLAIEEFLQARRYGGYAPSTLNLFRNYYKDFFKYLRTREKLKDLKRVDRHVIARYQTYLQTRPKSVHFGQSARLMALKDFFMWLERRGVLFRETATTVDLPKPPKPLTQENVTKEDIRKLLDAVETETQLGLRDKAILELLCLYAVRPVELCKLTLSDYQREQQSISIISGKKSEHRTIALSPETIYYIEKYVKFGRCKFLNADKMTCLFLRLQGAPLEISHIDIVLQRYVRRAGFKHYIAGHQIRSIAVQNLFKEVKE